MTVVGKFLGILFHYDDYNGWKLNQENVIDEMFERFGLAESAPVRVSIGGEDGDKEGALLIVLRQFHPGFPPKNYCTT